MGDQPSQRTLLVVDDDSDLLELIDLAFGRCHRVLPVSDAETALQLLSTTEVDAILSDVVMPRMDGLAFLREVRARGIDIPCLLLSGCPQKAERIADEGVDVFAILRKPCPVRELLAACDRALATAQSEVRPRASVRRGGTDDT